MHKEANAEFQRAVDLSPDNLVAVSLVGYTYALAGRRDEAIKILNELKARSKREYMPPEAFCLLYTALGDKDRAFTWLEKACEERTSTIFGSRVWRVYLRSDPRYQGSCAASASRRSAPLLKFSALAAVRSARSDKRSIG
jgi:serine/threonine-protein kinase